MEYKTTEEQRKKSLEYYYKNRKKVLEYQKKRWSEKYHEEGKFREKRLFRDASRRQGDKNINDGKHFCTKCNSTKDLQRHHPRYDNLNYIIVCRNCHNKKHFVKI